MEFWLLSEIIRGTSEAEVALQLFVYEDTVRQRLRNIFRKIGVRTRAEAAAWLVSGPSDAQRERAGGSRVGGAPADRDRG